jgi:hypothetical protein
MLAKNDECRLGRVVGGVRDVLDGGLIVCEEDEEFLLRRGSVPVRCCSAAPASVSVSAL